MSTLLDTEVRHESTPAGAGASVMAAVKRSFAAYLVWRDEKVAIAHLKSMSERELRDIGLTRAQIPFAVKGARARDRVDRNCF